MTNLAQFVIAELTHFAEAYGPSIAIVAGAAVTYLLMVLALRSLRCRHYLPDPLVATLRRIGFWVILVAAGLLILQAQGALQSVIAAVTGVFALLAIGFVAVWSVLSNTLCSLILMITRPFRIGDSLSLPPDGLEGKVVNFNMIFTTLETEEDLYLLVPNNIFFQRPVVRKVGKWRIGLADQLYESKNATGEPRQERPEVSDSQKAA